MQSRASSRSLRNPVKIAEGKSYVFAQLGTANSRCSSQMDRTLVNDGDGEFMSCNAEVYEGSDDAVSTGAYNSGTSTHAEMNALSAYIAQETDFETISRIVISSPPCKSCAFVLELLGAIDKVRTTGDVYKNATSSWEWPQALRDPRTFDGTRWRQITGKFANSGLSDAEILEAMVSVVKRQSAL
jgi:deoxycytidylate deaminase